MERAAVAGVLYFAAVVAVGFVLGTGRALWLEPWLGKLNATLIEVPVILAVSWAACLLLTRRLAVPEAFGARIVMGGLAFALLMAAEAGLSVFVFGRTQSAFVQGLITAPELPGFLAQILFALFPAMQLLQRKGT